jgi:hypothetical protein
VRITLRPNGYAICALLAGTLVGGALLAPERNWLELLALWVLVDLALGAFYTGLVHLVGLLPLADDRRGAVPAELIPAIGGAGLALLIATGLGEPVAYLTQAALALGVVIALTAGRSPHREAAPMLTGLQVLVAWTLGFVQATHWQSPLLALGLVAAIGTWGRLRSDSLRADSFADGPIADSPISDRPSPDGTMLWTTRLAWAAWVGALLVARQPLLAGVLAVTALADDLHRLGPGRQPMPGMLLNLSWLGSWVLVAIAAGYWGVVP